MSGGRQGPLFADLVFNEEGEVAEVVTVGGVPCYAVRDGDFLRHVEAEHVDRQIIELMKQRFLAMRDVITDGVAHLMGGEGLFTRATIEHAIRNMDQILTSGGLDVDQLRTALWMSKFRATVDVHGDVVRLDMPGAEIGEEDL
jgi:hypothetical protein